MSESLHDLRSGYAVIGIYRPGVTQPSLMSSNGRIIVFDHPQQAKDYLPLLGNGRITRWMADGETVYWLPMEADGMNRACVITGYDVYNLPPGLPVRSETRNMAWKHHIPWAEWVTTPEDAKSLSLAERLALGL